MATAAAKRYARAVFELAEAEGHPEDWSRRVARIADLFANAEVAAVLTNPTIPVDQRMALVSDSPHDLDAEATNLAKLLIESNRVRDASGIAEEYDRLVDEAAGRVRATLTTAVELKAADRDRVAGDLSRRLGKDVRIEVVVDPRILGGLKLQYGDRLIDASVSTKLQQLRRRLVGASQE
ncbi:MAG TPA: F0F1 ATP synthase subunit delta [Candidatus Dormibacteraeota bacterium]